MLNHKRKSNMFKIFGFKQTEPEPIPWDIDEEFHSKLSVDVIKQIYAEAEKRFNSTVDDISNLRTRAYSLITVFISLLSILITLYFGDYLDSGVSDKKVLAFLYFINITMITYVIVQLVIIVFPSNVMLKGEEPKKMNYEVMASLNKDEQKEIYLFNLIRVIQRKIDYNEFVLEKKNMRLESVIFISTFIFVFTLVFEFIIKIF